ncbi:TIGR03087 family PEP-CTERM/XrtA system glycosyltransferase [Arthrobacter sp. TPD3018]|uniref:TIGR03087 family PEP-CTERM/XrtA system glycosyltransferase n=1 Tax=Bacteria TaxID=2 RepID=UPI000D51B194|nr:MULTISPECIES: TIGR03087 family PEP-CTERM/XrtA system glycosyltransferase [Bacteria]PVE59594.1 TIGR03087 family PEP-CTERM/XrtA system glycosyltransferase [Sphingomonas sp. TPD3009]PVE61110.1 TIGR03087 family PEP-CTERM/XrtA system glycosyltransferase [Arthrobacter sp. TPD3018]PVE85971.1 TIGR03087 family PEP-CTERM/XrtA system glycosyltransferase [Sphingomonas melonis]
MDLLFLAHRAPFPPDRGDKIRSYHVLRYLMARARVHLVAFGDSDADFDVPAPIAEGLESITLIRRTKPQALAAVEALATGRPVSLTAFDAAAMRRAVAARRVDAVYCFSGQMAQYLPAGVPAVMDFVDVDSAKFAQFADAGSAAMRWMMRREARLLGAFERQVSATVRASLFVSEAEAALFRSGGGAGRIVAVENGIDAAAFDPTSVGPATQGPLLVFTGQMDYRPNVEAVVWFAAEVTPRLRETHPGVRFAIVGRAPTAAVQALAAPDVIVTGAVDDVRPRLAAASVCVAPLHLARGIQNKVLEAMAMARPVVASPAAAEGIDHAGTLRVAGSATEQAAAIGALLDDPDAASALGAAARARVLARYDWAARLAPLDDLLGLSA